MYGLPKAQLTEDEHKQVRNGVYFAVMTAATATLAHELGIPWIIENPEPRDNPVSFFRLPEWVRLAALSGVEVWDFDQCPMGAETAKPTRLLTFKVDCTALLGRCGHPCQSWHYTDFKGQAKSHWGPHPPLVNRRRSNGEMATKQAALYPSEMNLRLAEALSKTSC